MNWKDIIELIFVVILGGKWMINVLTIKSQKKKVQANADSAEIDNAQKVVNLYEQFEKRRSDADAKQIAELNKKIIDLENLLKSFQKTVEKFTKAINKSKECPGVENCIILRELKEKES